MAKVRKTKDVAELVQMANHFMRNTDDKFRGERLGVASFVESILHSSNAYSGFAYLTAEQLPSTRMTPGVVWEGEPGKGKPTFPDDSRRSYILHRQLMLGSKITLS